MLPHSVRLLLVLLFFAPLPASADRLANATGNGGFAADRLKRLSETLQAEIGKGTMPGAVLMIQQRQGCLLRSLGRARSRAEDAHAQGCDFPHLLHVEADHHHHRHAAR
jgi:hypothetical protein